MESRTAIALFLFTADKVAGKDVLWCSAGRWGLTPPPRSAKGPQFRGHQAGQRSQLRQQLAATDDHATQEDCETSAWVEFDVSVKGSKRAVKWRSCFGTVMFRPPPPDWQRDGPPPRWTLCGWPIPPGAPTPSRTSTNRHRGRAARSRHEPGHSVATASSIEPKQLRHFTARFEPLTETQISTMCLWPAVPLVLRGHPSRRVVRSWDLWPAWCPPELGPLRRPRR